MNPKRYIGCCGAYCKTCKPFTAAVCGGCKIGFDTGRRDIGKAKCKIKLCCFKEHSFDTCADCSELGSCAIIGSWFAGNGYKYKKYKQAIEYIKKHGYPEFIKLADKWKNASGKYE
ncbi:MAG: DUF3795 domain-containing protein [Candidatus Margulisbacteria bacterium]|nr:DUF3795 domain-containing protein [Candidatus Margulisiibacteriota bacterium]